MALRPEEETRGKKKRPTRREKTAATGGTGFFGIHLDFWPFSTRGEYPADKETHDRLNDQHAPARPARRDQTRQS